MNVRAELYARLREIAGRPAIDLVLPERATVNELWTTLRARFPALSDFETSVLFGLGVEFVAREHALSEGDAVAVMPPVQGG